MRRGQAGASFTPSPIIATSGQNGSGGISSVSDPASVGFHFVKMELRANMPAEEAWSQ